MNTQLRKITINDKIYLYTKADYYLGNEQSMVKLRIFLQGEKTTPPTKLIYKTSSLLF